MPIYLDHNASTRIDDRVFEAMLPFLKDGFGNPSARHALGSAARAAINIAREQVAAAVGVRPSQVIFGSGGTEANNLFVKGVAAMLKPSTVLVSAVEHASLARPAERLEKSGWRLRKIAVDSNCQIDFADAEQALASGASMMSVMLANNETGGKLDFERLACAARERGIWTHTDAVQAFGKIPVDFNSLGAHAMSLSSHKICGPKGAGALIVDKKLPLAPLIEGGGQEMGWRGGTENVAGIVGFGAAAELAVSTLDSNSRKLAGLRERLNAGLAQLGCVLFGDREPMLPNTSFFACPGINGETLVIELDRAGFCVGSGAACSSNSGGASATLLAMGVPMDLARAAVRVSFGHNNSAAEVDEFLSAVRAISEWLRRLAPLSR